MGSSLSSSLLQHSLSSKTDSSPPSLVEDFSSQGYRNNEECVSSPLELQTNRVIDLPLRFPPNNRRLEVVSVERSTFPPINGVADLIKWYSKPLELGPR
ncbi:hypothetical protein DEO72_LG1g2162 [Vigna unguiculata]|uniref:Uncharacterized protein n=1 Tax=Vigna unguiculata TaxID=3917 RepID=A0A4D6KKJ3_VIGUN|nr:hypothetical protein DEO72_LG1g2162 [Vigna unguiculata]